MTLTKYNYNTTSLSKFFDDIDRYTIGLDHLFDRLSTLSTQTNSYPPYNLIKVSNTDYRLELAASGFKKSELSVYTLDDQLVIEGTKDEKESHQQYIYRSLSARNFKRVWTLSESMSVKSVDFVDGLLTIFLELNVPEPEKPKKMVYF